MQLWNSQNTPQNASESVSYLPEIRFRPGGFAPLVPLPGLCPGPTGGLGGPHTPRLLCFHIVQGLATPLAYHVIRAPAEDLPGPSSTDASALPLSQGQFMISKKLIDSGFKTRIYPPYSHARRKRRLKSDGFLE